MIVYYYVLYYFNGDDFVCLLCFRQVWGGILGVFSCEGRTMTWSTSGFDLYRSSSGTQWNRQQSTDVFQNSLELDLHKNM